VNWHFVDLRAANSRTALIKLHGVASRAVHFSASQLRYNPLVMLEFMLVSRIFVSWNQLHGWLRQIEMLRRAT